MNKKELAELLNNSNYYDDLCNKVSKLSKDAKESKLVIVYGVSDDLLEFGGAIDDEIGAYNGTTAMIIKTKKGIKFLDEDGDDGDWIGQRSDKSFLTYTDDYTGYEFPITEIKAEWSPDDIDCSWRISTKLPHETFNVMEDEELFCIGIVFDFDDIKGRIKDKYQDR